MAGDGDQFFKRIAQESSKYHVQITGEAVGRMKKSKIMLALQQRKLDNSVAKIEFSLENNAVLVEFKDEHERDMLLDKHTIRHEGKILSFQSPTISWWKTIMDKMKDHNVFIHGISEEYLDSGELMSVAMSNKMCCKTSQKRDCEILLNYEQRCAVIIYHQEEVANTVLQNHTPPPNSRSCPFNIQGDPIYKIFGQHVRDIRHGLEESKAPDVQPSSLAQGLENPTPGSDQYEGQVAQHNLLQNLQKNDPPGPWGQGKGSPPVGQPKYPLGPDPKDQQGASNYHSFGRGLGDTSVDHLNNPSGSDQNDQQVGTPHSRRRRGQDDTRPKEVYPGREGAIAGESSPDTSTEYLHRNPQKTRVTNRKKTQRTPSPSNVPVQEVGDNPPIPNFQFTTVKDPWESEQSLE